MLKQIAQRVRAAFVQKQSAWLSDQLFRQRYVDYLRSDTWRLKRRIVLERALYRCEWVSRTGRRCDCTKGLEVHHLTYLHFSNELPEELQVLCRRHHKIADRRRVAEREKQERALKTIHVLGTPKTR